MTDRTIRDVLETARQQLTPVSDSPGLDARLLLAHVLHMEHSTLIAHPERPLSPEQAALFDALLARATAGEPVPYLLGRWGFFRHDFIVTPDVLIPRPETEHLIETALGWTLRHSEPPGDGDGLNVVDIGTGSGAIAVSLAAALPHAAVHATDISPAALEVACRNAQQIGVSVTFHRGDLLDALPPAITPDLVAANLPYIASDDLAALPVARHEPRLALDGGPDGLDLVRRLVAQAADRLAKPGCLLLEIGAGQGDGAAAICRAAFPGAAVHVISDYAGHDRLVEVAR